MRFILIATFALLFPQLTFAAPLPTSLVGKWNRSVTMQLTTDDIPIKYKVTWTKRGSSIVQTIKSGADGIRTITLRKNHTVDYRHTARGITDNETGKWKFSNNTLTISTISGVVPVFNYSTDDPDNPETNHYFIVTSQTFFSQELKIQKKSAKGSQRVVVTMTENDNGAVSSYNSIDNFSKFIDYKP